MLPNRLPQINLAKQSQKTASNIAGINQRDFEQLLKEAVIKATNYWKPGIGQIAKAPGLVKQYEITTGTDGGTAPKVLKEWFPGYDVIAYGKSLAVRDTIAGTTISVKTDFTANVTDGEDYGGYFYVADGKEGDNVGYLKATLAYDAQTENYGVGKILTGADSEARAIILADTDAGVTGTLTLNILSGSFTDGEIITDNSATPGSATVNGTLAVTWTEIADAPACEYIAIIEGNRLLCANTAEDPSGAHISRADQLSGVPFVATADWTVGTLPESPFKLSDPKGGEVKSIGRIGSQTVLILDDGKFGFRVTQVDVAATGLAIDTPIDFQNIDFGGSQGAISTSIGIIYVNEAGVWIMSSGGQTATPYTTGDQRISEPLGREFTKNYNFDDTSIVKDDDKGIVIIAARDNASANNVALIYHLEKDLAGWMTWRKRIGILMKKGKDIYCSDSQATAVYKLDYDAGTDDGQSMYTELVLEYNSSGTENLVSPKSVSIAGKLGSGSKIDISVDTYNDKWQFVPRVSLNGEGDKFYSFTTSGVGAMLAALGSGAIGSAAIGGRGIGEGSSLIPSRGQRELGMSDFSRVRLRIESLDKYQHVINLLTLFLEDRGPAMTSNLTSNSS